MSELVNISYSSHSKFQQCSEKYWLSKDFQSALIPSPLVFGKSIELAIEALLLGTHTLAQALEVFDTDWEKDKLNNHLMDYLSSDTDDSLIFEKDEEGYGLPKGWRTQIGIDPELANFVAWLCCLIRGRVLITAFHDKLLPKIKLHAVDGKPCAQIEIEIKNEEGDKVRGFIDFVISHVDYPGIMISDLKTASKKYTDDQLNDSEQLRTYVAAKGAELGTRRAGYIVLIKKLLKVKTCESCGAPAKNNLAKKCVVCPDKKYVVTSFDGDIQFVCKEFNDQELEAQLDTYANTVLAIKAGVREKNKENCFSYGRKCEFYDHCWENKPLEQIEYLEKKEKIVLTAEVKADTIKE